MKKDLILIIFAMSIIAEICEIEEKNKKHLEIFKDGNQCKCAKNDSKNQQIFYKEILSQIKGCKNIAIDISLNRDNSTTLYKMLCNIEKKLNEKLS